MEKEKKPKFARLGKNKITFDIKSLLSGIINRICGMQQWRERDLKKLDRTEVPLFHAEKVSPDVIFSFCRQGKYFLLMSTFF